jgi:hypothetical protein
MTVYRWAMTSVLGALALPLLAQIATGQQNPVAPAVPPAAAAAAAGRGTAIPVMSAAAPWDSDAARASSSKLIKGLP